LLGSATPSIETYFNGKSGKYGLVEIKERYGNVMMPDIKLVDLKINISEKKNERPFDTLIELQCHSIGEQVILFQNREILSFSRMHDLWARTALSAM
jgi:primosomal protein N' (replication factor Y)